MKRIFVLMIVSLVMLACGEKSCSVTAKEPSGQVRDYVEVIYFHGKQRCLTCRSRVVYRVIDISKKENAPIAKKYQVTWASLFLVQHKDGKEKTENLTEFAFAHSRTQPAKFKAGITKNINQALK